VLVRHRQTLRRLRTEPGRWWWWLGGLAGAAVVASTAEGVPQIGVALVSVCIVAGTAVGALAVDEMGLGPGGRRHLSAARVGGAALAIAAVTLGAVGDRHAAVRPLLFAALTAAGAASAWQQAANGQLRRTTNVPVASLVSFSGGTLALAALTLSRGELDGAVWPGEWWLYVGGLLGAVYIALAAASVRRLGVLQLSLATVAGQLLGAVLLDIWWPAPGIRLHLTTVIGVILTFVAVAVSGLRRTSVHA
jgi:bacterial/archaeal transporter family-2 protein